jgi:acetyl-CoA C-acetyltransferase
LNLGFVINWIFLSILLGCNNIYIWSSKEINEVEIMYISGIGRTKFGALSESLPELLYEAMYHSLKDSNLEISDIDAIFVSNFLGGPLNGQLHLNSLIASLLPEINIPIIRIETACASSGSAINQAINSLQKYDNVMILGAEKNDL